MSELYENSGDGPEDSGDVVHQEVESFQGTRRKYRKGRRCDAPERKWRQFIKSRPSLKFLSSSALDSFWRDGEVEDVMVTTRLTWQVALKANSAGFVSVVLPVFLANDGNWEKLRNEFETYRILRFSSEVVPIQFVPTGLVNARLAVENPALGEDDAPYELSDDGRYLFEREFDPLQQDFKPTAAHMPCLWLDLFSAGNFPFVVFGRVEFYVTVQFSSLRVK